jgi:hypothetical protein
LSVCVALSSPVGYIIDVIDGKFSVIETDNKSLMTVNNYHLRPIVNRRRRYNTKRKLESQGVTLVPSSGNNKKGKQVVNTINNVTNTINKTTMSVTSTPPTNMRKNINKKTNDIPTSGKKVPTKSILKPKMKEMKTTNLPKVDNNDSSKPIVSSPNKLTPVNTTSSAEQDHV